MRKSLFISILLIPIVIVLSIFSSCRQCNNSVTPVVQTDTTSVIPGLAEINEAIKKDSINPMLYFKRAQIYEGANDFKSAATDMFIALTLDSLRPEFYIYAADLFKKTGEPQRGIALMNKAIVSDSANTAFYVKAAELAYIDTTIKGNYRLALNYLNAAIGKDMQNADIYFFKGQVFKEKGDTSKAISSFQTATELNPKHYNAYVQIGLLMQQRKDKNAEKYLDNAIKVSDKPEDALYAKANMQKQEAVALEEGQKTELARQQYLRAIATFKKVVEVNHRNVEAYMGIAFSYYQTNSLQEAYHYYDLATKIEPTYAGAYFSKGLVAEEMGRTNEAIMLYQNCLNLDQNFIRAKEHLRSLQQVQ